MAIKGEWAFRLLNACFSARRPFSGHLTSATQTAKRRWKSPCGVWAVQPSPGGAYATSTATQAQTTTQLPLTQVATCKSSQPTARSATLRIGTTLSGPADQLSLRPTYYTTPDNALIPLAGGICAGHLTQSHLLAARSILTLVKHTSWCVGCVSTRPPISRNCGS